MIWFLLSDTYDLDHLTDEDKDKIINAIGNYLYAFVETNGKAQKTL